MSDGGVVITGRGVLSPLGCDWPSFAAAVRAGVPAQAAPFPESTAPDPPLCYLIAGLEDVRGTGEPLGVIAIEAARAALAEAGVCASEPPHDDVGLIMNTVLGPSGAVEAYLERLQEKGPRASRPAQFVDTLLSMPASKAGIELGLRGSTAVLGGSSAFEVALDWLRHGRERTVIVGGAEYQSPKCLRYHRELARRSGVARSSLGQGAAFLVLETPERAQERGACSYGELLGAGVASEPQEVAVPWSADPKGQALELSMRSALADAGLEPRDVGLLALAAGDDASEEGELAAVRAVFGEQAASLTLLRPKRLLGDTLAASESISLLAALAALETGGAGIAMANAFEMGGGVSSLVVRAPP